MSLRVGLVGCGDLSEIYLANAALFADFAIVACADHDPAASRGRAEQFGIAALPVAHLLASEGVDIVLNLAIREAHAVVSQSALEAGKHVYSERPLATTMAGGIRLVDLARAKGLRLGVAPDTVLGPAIQEARRALDAGAIGRPILGLAAALSRGMEHWHPEPGFVLRPADGPVLAMGPSYLSTLVTLLGPVRRVAALGRIGAAERVVSIPSSPLGGHSLTVETPTSLQALLDFENGVQVTFLASSDVPAPGVLPLELHGEAGSMRVPDPNWFGGTVWIAKAGGAWEASTAASAPFGSPNDPGATPEHADYRGLGLADMARAITERRPHRANGEIGLHVLCVMTAILEAAETGHPITVARSCERPSALTDVDAAKLRAAPAGVGSP